VEPEIFDVKYAKMRKNETFFYVSYESLASSLIGLAFFPLAKNARLLKLGNISKASKLTWAMVGTLSYSAYNHHCNVMCDVVSPYASLPYPNCYSQFVICASSPYRAR